MGFHGCHVRVLLLVDLYQIDDSLYIPRMNITWQIYEVLLGGIHMSSVCISNRAIFCFEE